MNYEKESFEQSYENESEKNIAYWQNRFGEACYLNGFVNWLKNLLTWIPVEERLPDEDGVYMANIAPQEESPEVVIEPPMWAIDITSFYRRSVGQSLKGQVKPMYFCGGSDKNWYHTSDENYEPGAFVTHWFDHNVLKMRDRL